VLEEGFSLDKLRRICRSIAETAREAGVQIVTGDTKVVGRGCGDGIYINTSGVGLLPASPLPVADGMGGGGAAGGAAGSSGGGAAGGAARGSGGYPADGPLGGARCQPGDSILISGTLGDHGIAILSTREGLNFSTTIESDAAPLNHLIANVLQAAPHVRCFRDPTRGGLASTLNELAAQSNTVMTIDEDAVPVRDQVRAACEMLGYDVFQVANEGKMVCVVPADEAEAALAAMRSSRYGENAACIGEVTAIDADGDGVGSGADAGVGAGGSGAGSADGSSANGGPRAYVRTAFGSKRVLDMLTGEQLPRIC
jgi:hydrogenase expression/formation protein HypE